MQKSKPSLLYPILILLAVFSLIGLDYIGWKKGEKSFLFSSFHKPSFHKKEAILLDDRSLWDIVLERLSSLNIGKDAISQYRDQEGIHHIMIKVAPDRYKKLNPRLQRELSRVKASISIRKRDQDQDIQYYLWKVEGKGELISLLFFCRSEKQPPEIPIIPKTAKNKVAIIVDDMGYSLDSLSKICSLDESLTIAVLPFSPFAKETASIAHSNSLEVILHLPLESLNNIYDNNHTEGIIHANMSHEEIIKTTNFCIQEIPYISGINTHMGSKITSNQNLMGVILEQIKGTDLYFIDSRTTADSVAYDIAQQMGIPSAFRHVFLDTKLDEEYIKSQLLQLFNKARKNGKAIGICHPSPETLNVLKNNLHLISEYDLEAVFASEIVQ